MNRVTLSPKASSMPAGLLPPRSVFFARQAAPLLRRTMIHYCCRAGEISMHKPPVLMFCEQCDLATDHALKPFVQVDGRLRVVAKCEICDFERIGAKLVARISIA